MTPISLRYSRGLAIAELVVGVLLFVVSLISTQWIGVFAGAVFVLLGVLMLVNPMVKIEATEVRLCSPLGFTTRRHPLSSPTDLRIQGKSLVHTPSGKKVASLGFGVHAGDVEQLRAQVGNALA